MAEDRSSSELPAVLVVGDAAAAADGTLDAVRTALQGGAGFTVLWDDPHAADEELGNGLMQAVLDDMCSACVVVASGPDGAGTGEAGGRVADLVELAVSTRAGHIIVVSGAHQSDSSDVEAASTPTSEAVVRGLTRVGLDQAGQVRLGEVAGGTGVSVQLGLHTVHVRHEGVEGARAAVEAAVQDDREPRTGSTAVLMLYDTHLIADVGPVLVGHVVGDAGAEFRIQRGTLLRVWPTGATAEARSMEGTPPGESGPRPVESAVVGQHVGVQCEGAEKPPGFSRGAVVSAGDAPLPGFAVSSRFRAVLTHATETPAVFDAGTRLGITRGASKIECEVESSELVISGAGEGVAWVAVLHAEAPAMLCTHAERGKLGFGGMRLRTPGLGNPAVGVALITAVLPDGEGAQ